MSLKVNTRTPPSEEPQRIVDNIYPLMVSCMIGSLSPTVANSKAVVNALFTPIISYASISQNGAPLLDINLAIVYMEPASH